MKIQPV